MKFAPLVRSTRRRADLTQDQLAVLAKVSSRAAWEIEQGGGTLKTLAPILQVLNVPIAGLPPGRDLGSRLKAARLKRRWALRELSERTNLAIPTVCGLERNAGRVTSLEAAIAALAPKARERKPPRRPTHVSQPVVSSGMQMFIQGDCMEVMPTLEPGSIDLVVTSPPYRSGMEYEAGLTIAEYERFAERWTSCIPRLLTPSGALWLNVGYTKVSETETLPLTYLYYSIMKRLGLHLIQEVIWYFEGGQSYTRRFTHRSERWMWWVKDPTNYVFNLEAVRDGTLNRTEDVRNSPHGKNPTDVWHFDRVVGGRGAGREKTMHPCQTPIAMLERITRACSNPGDVVLDPFGGAGSTAEAAYRNGRGFISIEKDADYHEISKARLANLTSRGR